ncbi:MAG: outer membrane protein assembly factor BamD, partial [Calditrichaeota bacterium]
MKVKQAIKLLILLALALTGVGGLHAQVSNEVQVNPEKESEFRKALSAYLSRDYRDAFVEFEALSNSPYPHQRMTATLLMTGKSLYQLDRFRDALPYFDKLIKTYPQSKYVDDAYYAKATALYRLGRYFDSGRNLTWILDHSRDDRLVAKAGKLVDYLLRNTLSESEGQDLLQYTTTESAAALVTMALARKEIDADATEEAIAVLNEFKNKYPNSQYLNHIDKLLDKARLARNRPVKVGVVLPLTGVYQEQGLGVLRGIDFAYMQTKDQSPVPVQLVVRDSESR